MVTGLKGMVTGLGDNITKVTGLKEIKTTAEHKITKAEREIGIRQAHRLSTRH
jgi:hypothetical protein